MYVLIQTVTRQETRRIGEGTEKTRTLISASLSMAFATIIENRNVRSVNEPTEGGQTRRDTMIPKQTNFQTHWPYDVCIL